MINQYIIEFMEEAITEPLLFWNVTTFLELINL